MKKQVSILTCFVAAVAFQKLLAERRGGSGSFAAVTSKAQMSWRYELGPRRIASHLSSHV